MKNKKSTAAKPNQPFVSVCTPTFNRRPFIPIMFECFRNQKYPKHRLEWIIIDDGTDKIKDLVEEANIPQIKYYPVDKKMTLGAKRNMMHTYAKGSIIVYMDDDDYYPPERISHAVETLLANPNALCAGTSEIYLYFKHIRQMYQFGPYNPNHATAATFAFRRELLNISRYDDKACIAEEKQFLKEYSIPFVQLDPMKTILVFSHDHNSFDKRKLLDNQHPNFVKPSNKTVDMFIRTPAEANIKKFFMEDIEGLLAKYAPGDPKLKTDVLQQMKEIDIERKKTEQQMQQQLAQQQMAANGGIGGGFGSPFGPNQQPQIMMQAPGQPPVAITIMDAVSIINQQQQQLQRYEFQIKDLEDKLRMQTSPFGGGAGVGSKSVSFSDPLQMPSIGSENASLKAKVQELENKNKALENMLKQSKNTFANSFSSAISKSSDDNTTDNCEKSKKTNIPKPIIPGTYSDVKPPPVDYLNLIKKSLEVPETPSQTPLDMRIPQNNTSQYSWSQPSNYGSKLEPAFKLSESNSAAPSPLEKPYIPSYEPPKDWKPPGSSPTANTKSFDSFSMPNAFNPPQPIQNKSIPLPSKLEPEFKIPICSS